MLPTRKKQPKQFTIPLQKFSKLTQRGVNETYHQTQGGHSIEFLSEIQKQERRTVPFEMVIVSYIVVFASIQNHLCCK